MNGEQFPDPTLLQLKAETYELSAGMWKAAFRMQRRRVFYGSVPGLLCGIGVAAVGESPGWLNWVAGAAIGSALVTLGGASVSFWREHKERQADKALAARLFDTL